jgi:glycosyltransferase involved in cell wall biosynthesis
MKENPLVSLCLFSYNQEKFIKEAIEGALKQTYSPLEIIISDDCSTDFTFEIIKEVVKNYSGPHKIILNRNEKNLGLVEHVNNILYKISKGEYVAMAAGDDISHHERIEKSIHFILMQKEEIMALSTSRFVIDENSELAANQREDTDMDKIYDFKYYISDYYRHVNGLSRILNRKLIDSFPALKSDCQTEDTTFLLRAFILGNVAILKEKLIKQRIHGSNLSSHENLKKMKTENIFKQNEFDLDFALSAKYINNEIYSAIKRKNEAIKKQRLGLKKMSWKSKIKNFFKLNKHA